MYSSSFWLNYGQASEEAKENSFTKPSLAKVQERLDYENVS
ncbi:hypothetical protein HMPREF1982_02551 [Clostridiales bacterium oral taxon 876 str. F0540]|nr:hypothetical protein HMPREF1982_02551 [Clostridiales bacterium oral taxon 876 str. F0540]